MAMVRDVTISAVTRDDGSRREGELLGYSIRARVEVGGEDEVHEFTTEDAELRSLVDQLVARVHKEAMQQSQARLQSVLDAEDAFEQ